MKKDLQRFTTTEQKLTWLMNKSKITKADFNNTLNIKEKADFIKTTLQLINNTQGKDRNLLIEKVEAILPDERRTQIWESNHFVIIESMNKYIEQTGIMPTKQMTSYDTGISRQTIHKHLNDYTGHSSFKGQQQQFKFMAGKIIAAVIKEASEGNIKAARLYFELMGGLENKAPSQTLIKHQNNHIQLNSMVLNQDNIKHLNPEQLNAIEDILKIALPAIKN